MSALKEQHERELRRLREQSQGKEGRLDAVGGEGLERTQDQERLEEEVAKVGRLDFTAGFLYPMRFAVKFV